MINKKQKLLIWIVVIVIIIVVLLALVVSGQIAKKKRAEDWDKRTPEEPIPVAVDYTIREKLPKTSADGCSYTAYKITFDGWHRLEDEQEIEHFIDEQILKYLPPDPNGITLKVYKPGDDLNQPPTLGEREKTTCL